jgi:RNA polymerase sigma factor (sigma-70 family)
MAADPYIGRAGSVEPNDLASESAAAHLFERHSGRIFRFCASKLRSREEAEDATQTTFLYACRALQRGVVPRADLAWLLAIARNVCVERHRSRARRESVEVTRDVQALDGMVAAPERNGDLADVASALADMPEGQRRAILLREWQGLSYREIADRLDTSQGAVEALIFRARRSLAERLGSENGRARALRSFDVGSALAGLKSLLAGSAAKLAVTAAVVAVAAAAPIAVSLGDPARADRPGRPADSAAGRTAALERASAVGPSRTQSERARRAAVAAASHTSAGGQAGANAGDPVVPVGGDATSPDGASSSGGGATESVVESVTKAVESPTALVEDVTAVVEEAGVPVPDPPAIPSTPVSAPSVPDLLP